MIGEEETSYVRCRSLDDSTCALYEPLQGKSTRSIPRKRNNYINYVEILTGRQASELVDLTGGLKTRDWKTQDWKTREHHLYG